MSTYIEGLEHTYRGKLSKLVCKHGLVGTALGARIIAHVLELKPTTDRKLGSALFNIVNSQESKIKDLLYLQHSQIANATATKYSKDELTPLPEPRNWIELEARKIVALYYAFCMSDGDGYGLKFDNPDLEAKYPPVLTGIYNNIALQLENEVNMLHKTFKD